jgi:hypothetical protein
MVIGYWLFDLLCKIIKRLDTSNLKLAACGSTTHRSIPSPEGRFCFLCRSAVKISGDQREVFFHTYSQINYADFVIYL